jgi:hypothetical protein
VINEGAKEIHEQEVGHAVFGRRKDYETAAVETPKPDPRVRIFGALALVFAATSAVLVVRLAAAPSVRQTAMAAAVQAFWAGVFVPGQKTDIVLDSAALSLYQELDGRPAIRA